MENDWNKRIEELEAENKRLKWLTAHEKP
jgi:hypothetical protein